MYAVIESFRDYVEVETMDGENKYDAGEHGLQVGRGYKSIHYVLKIWTAWRVSFKVAGQREEQFLELATW